MTSQFLAWQDIESAPKKPLDSHWGKCGPYILVLIPYKPTPLADLGWWQPAFNCWRFHGDDGAEDIQPTHWMPLPEAPE